MVAKKPVVKNQTTGAMEQQQLSSSDMSDGPFYAPAGNDTYVQFKDGTVLGGDAGLTFDKGTGVLTPNKLGTTTRAGNTTFGENTADILVTALSGDGKYCGTTQSGTAGETLAFGQICYFKASGSKWWKAKADVAATSGPVRVGFCVLAGNANDTITILLLGKIRADSLFDTFTISAPVYISAATAGKIVSAAPTGTTGFVVRVVGRAATGDEIQIGISPDYIELA